MVRCSVTDGAVALVIFSIVVMLVWLTLAVLQMMYLRKE
jgi:hypothetical protein